LTDTLYYVVLNYNSGSPTISLITGLQDFTDNIPLGSVSKNASNEVNYISGCYRLQDGVAKLHYRAFELYGLYLTSGNTLAYSGTNNFTMTSGVIYEGINRLTQAAYDSAVVAFDYIHQDGVGGWTETPSNVIDYAHYDDGDGTLGDVGVSKYGCHWIYRHIDTGDIYVLYGRGSYSLAEAEVTDIPSGPDHLTNFGCLIGRIIAPQAGGSFSSVQMVTDTIFTGASVAVHNDLGGLNVADYKHLTAAEFASAILDRASPEEIGGTTPAAGDFEPLTAIAPAAIISFTGTVSAATRTATFTETADYDLCKVGSVLIAGGDTRVVVVLLGGDKVTVDADTTWGAATAITSVQDPISQHKDSAGNVDMFVNALGGITCGRLGDRCGISLGEMDVHFGGIDIYTPAPYLLYFSVDKTAVLKISTDGLSSPTAGGFKLNSGMPSNTIPTLTPNSSDGNTGIGRAWQNQLSLIAGGLEGIRIVNSGKPYTIIGGTQIANFPQVTFPTANKDQIIETGIGTGMAVGDLVLVLYAGAWGTIGAYRATVINSADVITVDRNIHSEAGDITDGVVSTIKDGLLISPTDGTNGQRIMGYSHQDKPLQLGGDTLQASASLGAEDILIGRQIALINDVWLSALNYAGSDTVKMFKVNVDDEIDVGATLVIGGSIEAAEDSGAVVGRDMPVSASAVAGTEMSFTDKIDGSNIFKEYAEADGTGGIQKPSVRPNAPIIYDQAPQVLTGAGAVDTTSAITHLVTNAANALTLADGVEGQIKFIIMKTDGGDGTLTPAHYANGTTLTFNDVGDSVNLMFTNGSWHCMGGKATSALRKWNDTNFQ
jgi:hypothetical protein